MIAAEPAGSSPTIADPVAPRPQRLGDAHQRASGADPVDEGGNAAARLLPELPPERVAEAGSDVGVVELIGRVRPGLPGKLAGARDHVPDVLGRDVARALDPGDDVELCAERAHELEALDAVAVGDHDPRWIPLGAADEGEGRAGAAAGVLDDGHPRLEETVPLGALDHRERHPVLHRSGRVQVLELDPHLGAVSGASARSRTSGVLPMADKTLFMSQRTTRDAVAFRSPRKSGREWAIVDSNHGPPPYQSGALTN